MNHEVLEAGVGAKWPAARGLTGQAIASSFDWAINALEAFNFQVRGVIVASKDWSALVAGNKMYREDIAELEVLKDVLQTIGDVKADISVFSVVTEKLNESVFSNSDLFVFALNLETLEFAQVFPACETLTKFRVRNLNYGQDPTALVEEVFNSLKSRVSEGGRKLIISPIYSLGILRAVVVVRHPDTNLDSDSRTLFINTLARTFLWVIERDRLLSIFRQVQQPINFKQSEAGYFSSLMGLIRTASQMPFIAIREYDRNEKTLRCIAQSGFRDLPQGALDLLDLSSGRFQPFTECVNKQKVCVATSYSDCPEIFDRVGKYGIKSFLVAPILVGDDIFGTVSFACAIENYEFSMLETAGFVAIANSVGLSITNFRSFHSQVEDERETAVRDMALYAVELAQYARHDARDHIEEGEAILEKLIKLVRRVDGAEKLTEAIRQKFRDLTAAMERIKEATAAPSEEIRPCLLKDVWETAFSGVQYKLDQKDIEWNVNGIAKDTATVFASSDHLRLTFAQLILNSYDAFLAQGAKVKNKHIRVDIGDPGSRANSYVIKYSDNAGGIDPSKLRRKTAGEFAESLAPEEQGVGAIFNRGVTSKLGKQGSGYGLFLARKRLRDVDGSIDIVDYRGGTTVFEIRLPKAQSADLKAAGRVS